MSTPDFSDGIMVALYPDEGVAKKVALSDFEGAQGPEDLHVTLAFIGKKGEDGVPSIDGRWAELSDVAKEVAKRHPPQESQVSGTAHFMPGDDGTPYVALVGSHTIHDLQSDLVNQLKGKGVPVSDKFPFVPHMTLAYLGEGQEEPEPLDEPIPLTFSKVVVKNGDHSEEYPFGKELPKELPKKDSGIMKSSMVKKESRLPDDVVEAFTEVGRQQRGEPEAAMLQLYKHGGGVLPFVAEHVGDLVHRMTHHVEYGTTYPDLVGEKVDKTLRTLKSPYGFEREHRENIDANGADPELFDAHLAEYADAHRRLPAYNRPQWLGRESAIALGEKDWSRAATHLTELQGMIDDDSFHDAAMSFERDEQGGLKQYFPPKTAGFEPAPEEGEHPTPSEDELFGHIVADHGIPEQELSESNLTPQAWHDGMHSEKMDIDLSQEHWHFPDTIWDAHKPDMEYVSHIGETPYYIPYCACGWSSNIRSDQAAAGAWSRHVTSLDEEGRLEKAGEPKPGAFDEDKPVPKRYAKEENDYTQCGKCLGKGCYRCNGSGLVVDVGTLWCEKHGDSYHHLHPSDNKPVCFKGTPNDPCRWEKEAKVAMTLWDHAKSIQPDLEHDPVRTDEGNAWVKGMGKGSAVRQAASEGDLSRGDYIINDGWDGRDDDDLAWQYDERGGLYLKGQNDCPDCEGKGDFKCEDCYGTGHDRPEQDVYECPNCSGDDRSCVECKGSGLTWANPPCDTCGGVGEELCYSCDGDGSMYLDHRTVHGWVGRDREDHGGSQSVWHFDPSDPVNTYTECDHIPSVGHGQEGFKLAHEEWELGDMDEDGREDHDSRDHDHEPTEPDYGDYIIDDDKVREDGNSISESDGYNARRLHGPLAFQVDTHSHQGFEAEAWKDCDKCGGATTLPGNEYSLCTSCGGKEATKCNACMGSGLELNDIECPKCGGEGNLGTTQEDVHKQIYDHQEKEKWSPTIWHATGLEHQPNFKVCDHWNQYMSKEAHGDSEHWYDEKDGDYRTHTDEEAEENPQHHDEYGVGYHDFIDNKGNGYDVQHSDYLIDVDKFHDHDGDHMTRGGGGDCNDSAHSESTRRGELAWQKDRRDGFEDDPSVYCEKCNGDPNPDCTKCKGVGKSPRCRPCDASGLINHKECAGTGWTADKCGTCGGEGTFSGWDQHRSCGGKGCKGCKHSGLQWREDECSSCYGKGLEGCKGCNRGKLSCPKCKGTGGPECSRCGGNGYTSCKHCDGEGSVPASLKDVHHQIWSDQHDKGENGSIWHYRSYGANDDVAPCGEDHAKYCDADYKEWDKDFHKGNSNMEDGTCKSCGFSDQLKKAGSAPKEWVVPCGNCKGSGKAEDGHTGNPDGSKEGICWFCKGSGMRSRKKQAGVSVPPPKCQDCGNRHSQYGYCSAKDDDPLFGYSGCPACGQPSDYCQGGGPDSDHERIVDKHFDLDVHDECDEDACDEAGRWEYRKCSVCGGVGTNTWKDTGKQPCKNCKGSGLGYYRAVEKESKVYQQCSQCGGTGISVKGYEEGCGACKGSGIIPELSKDDWVCEVCHDPMGSSLTLGRGDHYHKWRKIDQIRFDKAVRQLSAEKQASWIDQVSRPYQDDAIAEEKEDIEPVMPPVYEGLGDFEDWRKVTIHPVDVFSMPKTGGVHGNGEITYEPCQNDVHRPGSDFRQCSDCNSTGIEAYCGACERKAYNNNGTWQHYYRYYDGVCDNFQSPLMHIHDYHDQYQTYSIFGQGHSKEDLLRMHEEIGPHEHRGSKAVSAT